MAKVRRARYVGKTGVPFTKDKIYEIYEVGSSGRAETVDDIGNEHILKNDTADTDYIEKNFKYL